MIVITLSKTPSALGGDLTRWCQEIQTGVYVGEVSARIRDKLWERVVANIGNGEATLVYNTNTEQGYAFRTTRSSRRVIDLDGMLFIKHVFNDKTIAHGFSNAAKFHKAKVAERIKASSAFKTFTKFVAVDLETTGLDPNNDQILSIGAVKDDGTEFYRLINQKVDIPEQITELTGITAELLNKKGIQLIDALRQLKTFIGDLHQCGMEGLKNRKKDLLPVIKRKDKFLDNYKLKTVLSKYGIENKNIHNALSDARATKELASKLIKKHALVI